MESVISVNNLVKRYGNNIVVKDVSFCLEKGKIYGLLGPNGAGKTTIMKLLNNEIKKDGGSIRYNENINIKYLMDVPMFYEYMKVEEYLLFIASLNNTHSDKVKELLHITKLAEHKDKYIKQLSRGLRQKLAIASVLVNDVDVLILDEPISALDPIGRKEVMDLIKSLKGKICVIFSSHILSDIENVCDHILLIHNGVILVDGECSKVLEQKNILLVKLSSNSDALKIKELYEGSCFSSKHENTLEIEYTDLYALEMDVLKKAKKLSVCIEKLEIKRDSLEDIFLNEVISHE